MVLIAGRESSRRADIPGTTPCDIPKPIPYMCIFTINCHCAYPTVTYRLEDEKEPEVLTSAEFREFYSGHMLCHAGSRYEKERLNKLKKVEGS
jgi:hypothetical protein